ncbi:MAG: hypothetical protein LBO03_02590 [Acidaminococcales bacterium]|jgi:hypothetical protein|nr:hypothetical protein [Acidaminococcales bacterium]
MSGFVSLKNLKLLEIIDGGGKAHYGADQAWYEECFQKRAGCGPTCAAHLVCYLARAHVGCSALFECADGILAQEEFLPLMQKLWAYVTPGPMGVNNTGIFVKGAQRYGADRGAPLAARVLPVPVLPSIRPSPAQAALFLTDALGSDLPVAFLNLSNGGLANLDSWHWVTLVAFAPDDFRALMYDNGDRREIDLKKWLGASLLGGGFVALSPRRGACD